MGIYCRQEQTMLYIMSNASVERNYRKNEKKKIG